jgi:FkbM family methyltransferase
MIVRLPDGQSVHAANRAEANFLYQEIFLHQTYTRHGIALREGARVIDVGANIGIFALYLATTLRDFSLLAFEPIPEVFEFLRRNTRPFADKVELLNVGLSDHQGEATFTYYPHLTVMSSYEPEPTENLRAAVRDAVLSAAPPDRRGGLRGLPRTLLAKFLSHYSVSKRRSVRCRLETLSDVLEARGIDSIDLLKVDVEKAEADVLRGIREPHWAAIRQLVVEVHDVDGRLAAVTDDLRRRGFRVATDQEDALRDRGVYTLYAVSEARARSDVAPPAAAAHP